MLSNAPALALSAQLEMRLALAEAAADAACMLRLVRTHTLFQLLVLLTKA